MAQLSDSERWVLDALVECEQHLIDLSWLGRKDPAPAEAASVVLGLARKGFFAGVFESRMGLPHYLGKRKRLTRVKPP